MYQKGFITAFRNYFERRRIGELLVRTGRLTPTQLHTALNIQKQTPKPLGTIILERGWVSKNQLRIVLCKQALLRGCAAVILLSASCGGFMAKRSYAGEGQTSFQVAMADVGNEYKRAATYPALFGTEESRSANITPFTKWTGMLDNFERQLKDPHSKEVIKLWEAQLQQFKGQSLKDMADNVNQLMNKKRYILDNNNWGQSDYWATPVEFLTRGGDCEDFAITKYVALRALGVPEEKLRIAIVQDLQKNIPHAVLVVYTESGTYLLDNQNEDLVDAENGSRYRPIYSINRQAWWLHSAPTDQPSSTIVAAAGN